MHIDKNIIKLEITVHVTFLMTVSDSLGYHFEYTESLFLTEFNVFDVLWQSHLHQRQDQDNEIIVFKVVNDRNDMFVVQLEQDISFVSRTLLLVLAK